MTTLDRECPGVLALIRRMEGAQQSYVWILMECEEEEVRAAIELGCS